MHDATSGFRHRFPPPSGNVTIVFRHSPVLISPLLIFDNMYVKYYCRYIVYLLGACGQNDLFSLPSPMRWEKVRYVSTPSSLLGTMGGFVSGSGSISCLYVFGVAWLSSSLTYHALGPLWFRADSYRTVPSSVPGTIGMGMVSIHRLRQAGEDCLDRTIRACWCCQPIHCYDVTPRSSPSLPPPTTPYHRLRIYLVRESGAWGRETSRVWLWVPR